MFKKIILVLLILFMIACVGCSSSPPQESNNVEEAWKEQVAAIPTVTLELTELAEKLPAEVPIYPGATDTKFNDYSNIEHFGADTINYFYTILVPNTERVKVFDFYMDAMGPYMPEGGYNHFRRGWEVPFTVGEFSPENDGYDGSVKLLEDGNNTIMEILIKSY